MNITLNKIMGFLVVLAIGTPAAAQETVSEKYDKAMENHPVRFGIKAGLNYSNLTINNAGAVNDKKGIAGWHAGVLVDIPLLPLLSVQPGLLITQKGSKFTVGDNSGATYNEVTTRPLYLEMPVNVLLKIPLPNKVKIFAGAGPYIAAGITGKNAMEGRLLGTPFSDKESIQYGNDDPDNNGSAYSGSIKRFDVGANLIAGLEISHMILNANYGVGLTNIKPGSSNGGDKYKNRVFSVSVGVLF
jgi:hypothetical protein